MVGGRSPGGLRWTGTPHCKIKVPPFSLDRQAATVSCAGTQGRQGPPAQTPHKSDFQQRSLSRRRHGVTRLAQIHQSPAGCATGPWRSDHARAVEEPPWTMSESGGCLLHAHSVRVFRPECNRENHHCTQLQNAVVMKLSKITDSTEEDRIDECHASEPPNLSSRVLNRSAASRATRACSCSNCCPKPTMPDVYAICLAIFLR